jgi:O-acetylserine/cysteine efflux transporter
MRPLHFAVALLVIAVWGFNFVAIEVGLQGIPPLLFSFARFFLTSIPAVFFIKRPAVPFKFVIWYGLTMFALQFALLFMGMYAGIAPGLASLLLQLQAFFTILLAVIFLGEKLHPWQLIGAIISFSGIGLVAMHLGGTITLTGFLLVIGAAASWGVGNIISKKIGKVNMISLVVWGSLVAWPPLLLVSWMVGGTDQFFHTFQHLNWQSAGAILYITYLSTLFAFAAWSWLLHHYSLVKIAPFSLMVPVVAIVSSVLVLHEPFQLWNMIAALLIISGLCINLLGPRILNKKKNNL